jgi:hypothetical protein
VTIDRSIWAASDAYERSIGRGSRPVAVYVWDDASGMELIRSVLDVAIELDPGALALDEGALFPVCEPAVLRQLMRDAGLEAVGSRSIVVPTVFASFDDDWEQFLSGHGPAPAYAMSLAGADRGAPREQLKTTLPVQVDGPLELGARAFAVGGRR